MSWKQQGKAYSSSSTSEASGNKKVEFGDELAASGAETAATEATAVASGEALGVADGAAVGVADAFPLEPMALRQARPLLLLHNRRCCCCCRLRLRLCHYIYMINTIFYTLINQNTNNI